MAVRIADWYEAMTGSARGRATLANLYHDTANARTPRNAARFFLSEVAQHWERQDGSSLPEASFEAVVNKPGYSLLLTGPPISTVGIDVCRIMPADDLVRHNLHLGKIPFAIRGHVSQAQMELLARLGIKGAARGTMETRRPYAWITQAVALRAALPIDDADAATAARTLLGLLHFREDELLMQVGYPSGSLKTVRTRSPTFLEGCPSLVYRSTTTGDGWGRAVHLESLKDGLPEAVHEPVPFTDSFRVRCLGRLRPSKTVFDWEKFLATLPKPWAAEASGAVEAYVSRDS